MRITKYIGLHAGKNNQGKKYLRICVCNWRFVIANGPVSIKNPRNLVSHKLRKKIKARKLEEHECKCEICGKDLNWENAELHHILPVSLAPEFARDPKNMMILCHDCHKAIHSNPFVYSRQILDYYPKVAAQFSLQ